MILASKVETENGAAILAGVQKDRFLVSIMSTWRHGGRHVSILSDRSLHKAFKNAIIKQYVLDIPTDGVAEADSLLAGFHNHIAAVIEPLVQWVLVALIFHTADALAEISHRIKKHEILFIAR